MSEAKAGRNTRSDDGERMIRIMVTDKANILSSNDLSTALADLNTGVNFRFVDTESYPPMGTLVVDHKFFPKNRDLAVLTEQVREGLRNAFGGVNIDAYLSRVF